MSTIRPPLPLFSNPHRFEHMPAFVSAWQAAPGLSAIQRALLHEYRAAVDEHLIASAQTLRDMRGIVDQLSRESVVMSPDYPALVTFNLGPVNSELVVIFERHLRVFLAETHSALDCMTLEIATALGFTPAEKENTTVAFYTSWLRKHLASDSRGAALDEYWSCFTGDPKRGWQVDPDYKRFEDMRNIVTHRRILRPSPVLSTPYPFGEITTQPGVRFRVYDYLDDPFPTVGDGDLCDDLQTAINAVAGIINESYALAAVALKTP